MILFTKILFSFGLALEGKSGKEILCHQDSSSHKICLQAICFIRGRIQYLRSVKWRTYSRFTSVENTISKSVKVVIAMFLGKDNLFCVIQINKFSSFKKSFEIITSLSEFHFRIKIFSPLVQTKEVFSMSYGSCTTS